MGSMGDYCAYGFITAFLSFFFTTIVGIDPAVAGGIISAAIVWDAITDPICGTSMDAMQVKGGTRRAFIGFSIIPLGASIALLFLNVNFSPVIKNLYYVLMVLIFWTAYTIWNIPYYSLGGAITESEDERTKMAGIRQVTGFVGTFCSNSGATFLVGFLVKKGIADDVSWLITAIAIALITVIMVTITWKSTKGLEPENSRSAEKQSVKGLLTQIRQAMSFKPYLVIIAAALFCNVYMSLFNASVMYYASFCLGLSETQSAALFTAQTITSIVMIPIITPLALKFDKKYIYVSLMAFSGIVMILAKFIGINGWMGAIVYMILVGIGPAAYWMFIFNFIYDIIDAEELESGTRKDGIIVSYYSFLLKLGGAVASLILGILLKNSGFSSEASVQSAGAINMIGSLYTILSGIFMLASGLVVILTPLTNRKMDEVHKALIGKAK